MASRSPSRHLRQERYAPRRMIRVTDQTDGSNRRASPALLEPWVNGSRDRRFPGEAPVATPTKRRAAPPSSKPTASPVRDTDARAAATWGLAVFSDGRTLRTSRARSSCEGSQSHRSAAWRLRFGYAGEGEGISRTPLTPCNELVAKGGIEPPTQGFSESTLAIVVF